jgi:hypothetical protein
MNYRLFLGVPVDTSFIIHKTSIRPPSGCPFQVLIAFQAFLFYPSRKKKEPSYNLMHFGSFYYIQIFKNYPFNKFLEITIF